MSLFARVKHPPNLEVPGGDGHPKEAYVAVDDSGFLQLSPETTAYDPVEQIGKVGMFVWDTDTLQWVRATGVGGSSGGVAVSPPRSKRFDFHGSFIYIGEADPGAATSSPSWRIRRVEFDVNGNPASSLFAGAGAQNQIWDNRASLTYS